MISRAGMSRVQPTFWASVEWLNMEPRPRMRACVDCGLEESEGELRGQLLEGEGGVSGVCCRAFRPSLLGQGRMGVEREKGGLTMCNGRAMSFRYALCSRGGRGLGLDRSLRLCVRG